MSERLMGLWIAVRQKHILMQRLRITYLRVYMQEEAVEHILLSTLRKAELCMLTDF